MFEKKQDAVAPVPVFAKRLVKFLLIALLIISVALSIGVLGYHYIAQLNWIDALLDASMILGGMGPVNPLPSDAAKIFASFYALFSGIVFISTAGIILAPLLHRVLHKFHIDDDENNNS